MVVFCIVGKFSSISGAWALFCDVWAYGMKVIKFPNFHELKN